MSATEHPVRAPQPLAHFIAGELAQAIELGRYRPGERLVEVDIAARYGVSRAPVREALRMLTRDELVVQRPRRGTIVTELSPAEISEMFELRSALYAAVMRLFVRRAPPDDIQALVELFARVQLLAEDDAATAADFVEATQATSRLVVGRCGNRRLQHTFHKLNSQSYRHYAQLAHSTVAQRRLLVELARPMLAAVLAGDAEAASMHAWRLHESNHTAALAAIAAAADASPP